MNIIEKTAEFLDILELDDATLRDLYTKYGMLADAYSGSTGKSIVNDNKKIFEVILSDNIIDFISFMYANSALMDALASNPNLIKILDNKSAIYIKKIVYGLRNAGWEIRKSASASDIAQSLQYWGISEATEADLNGAQVISDENVSFEDDDNGIDSLFDEINNIPTDEQAAAEQAAAEQAAAEQAAEQAAAEQAAEQAAAEQAAEQAAAIFKSEHVDETYDVSNEKIKYSTDDDDEDPVDFGEKETRFDPKVS